LKFADGFRAFFEFYTELSSDSVRKGISGWYLRHFHKFDHALDRSNKIRAGFRTEI
jgi:hypothetical protein